MTDQPGNTDQTDANQAGTDEPGTDETGTGQAGAGQAGIYAKQSSFLERCIQLGSAQGRVLSVDFPRECDDGARGDHELLDRIAAYLAGERDEFDDVQIALTVPTTQRVVLDAVRSVPYGQETTVEQLAAMVPDAEPETEQVRRALAANPTPILVPTHRVRDGPGSAPADVVEKLRAVEGL